jgi:EAL domain-containing protein (putative c-di-GMP-specific phosphodiesterase class I)
LQSLGQPYRLREHDYSSTPSIGVVVFMDQHATIEELLKTADVAMYQAKAAGRNTLRFFDPTMQAAAVARAKLELDLRQGLIDKEFVLHYQIQVRGDGLTTGVEALVRWNNRERGLVAPGLFIPLAEETGVILSLGQWVLESACQQLQRWSHNPHTAAWNMAVNVSASQFAQADFVACVDRALQLSGANPQLLTLELTESMLVANVDDVISKMNQLKARGVSFSLDDFGTGYSSLSFLKHLPLEHLKIDQSFVRDLLTDPSDAEIARTIIMLGHSLGMQVIAEGVETAAQRDYLLQVGCDVFQGYYFGRPQAFP